MNETKKCPYCGEEIKAEAKKCRYCGEWLGETTNEVSAKQQQIYPQQQSNEAAQSEDDAEEMPIVNIGRPTWLAALAGFGTAIVCYIAYVVCAVAVAEFFMNLGFLSFIGGYIVYALTILEGVAIGIVMALVSQKESVACGIIAAIFALLFGWLGDETIEMDIDFVAVLSYIVSAYFAFSIAQNSESDEDDAYGNDNEDEDGDEESDDKEE